VRTVQLLQLELLHTIPSEEWNVPWEVQVLPFQEHRVERIRKFSTPKQWNYVPTDCNPADSATRTLQAHEIHSSKWLLGPTRSLYCENEKTNKELYQLIEPDGDQELRPAVKSAKTDTVSEPRIRSISIPNASD
jgi:hypothetical protein